MPLVTLVTSLPDDKLTEEFHLAFSSKLSEMMGKPEERISVTLECGRRISLAGSVVPVCKVHVASIGQDTREKNQPLAHAMTEFLTQHTGIPPNRIMIQFSALQPHLIAREGKLLG